MMLIHGNKDTIVPCKHAKFLYKLAVDARDKRWALNEKRLKLKEKEEGVMIWLLETKMRRREAKLRRQKEIASMWREAEREKTVIGTTIAPPPPQNTGNPLSPQNEIRESAPASRARSSSAPIDVMKGLGATKKSTQGGGFAMAPAPIALYVVAGAGHNNVDKIAGLDMVKEIRAFMISVLRFRPPEHQRPLLSSPQPVAAPRSITPPNEEVRGASTPRAASSDQRMLGLENTQRSA